MGLGAYGVKQINLYSPRSKPKYLCPPSDHAIQSEQHRLTGVFVKKYIISVYLVMKLDPLSPLF